uniref:Secreted protein n=1 Tax=Thraustotheca clavata TaxID=74557 RepID=A0A0A7CLI6_9STRA|nr:secreted protein [Thraustotheca clavata]
MAQNPLVALLLAANLTSFDPTKITPSDENRVLGVRVEMPQGRWWTAKAVDKISFPLLDVNSTVYVSSKSLTAAQATVHAPNNTYSFLFMHLFSDVGAESCDFSGIGTATFSAAFEQYYDKGLMGTTKITASANLSSGFISDLNSATLTDIVFRPFAGCFEFAGIGCNFDHDKNPPILYDTFKTGFSRDEFSTLNPSSGIDHCAQAIEYHENYTISPSWDNKGNVFNVAFKVPTKLWEHSTVQNDASLFYKFTSNNENNSTNSLLNNGTALSGTRG